MKVGGVRRLTVPPEQGYGELPVREPGTSRVMVPGNATVIYSIYLVGVVLMIGWVILLAATQRSLGVFGLMLGAMLLGGVVWLLVDIGWLNGLNRLP